MKEGTQRPAEIPQNLTQPNERTKSNEMPATRKKQADAMDADMATDEVRRARCDQDCDDDDDGDVDVGVENGRGIQTKELISI
jgi:hypothetical protein